MLFCARNFQDWCLDVVFLKRQTTMNAVKVAWLCYTFILFKTTYLNTT